MYSIQAIMNMRDIAYKIMSADFRIHFDEVSEVYFLRIFDFYSKLQSHQQLHTCVLATVWTSGLVTGILFCSRRAHISSWMVIAAKCNVSIVGLLLIFVLPLLILFAVRWKAGAVWIYFIAFSFACSLGINLMALSVAFGNAAWLLRILLLFSGSILSVIQVWLFLPCCRWSRKAIIRDYLVALGIGLTVAFADFLLISPFLSQVMSD